MTCSRMSFGTPSAFRLRVERWSWSPSPERSIGFDRRRVDRVRSGVSLRSGPDRFIGFLDHSRLESIRLGSSGGGSLLSICVDAFTVSDDSARGRSAVSCCSCAADWAGHAQHRSVVFGEVGRVKYEAHRLSVVGCEFVGSAVCSGDGYGVSGSLGHGLSLGNRVLSPTSGREDVQVGELIGHTGKSRSYHAAPLGACAPRSRFCLASVSQIPVRLLGARSGTCLSGLPCSIRSDVGDGRRSQRSRDWSGGFPFPLRLR